MSDQFKKSTEKMGPIVPKPLKLQENPMEMATQSIENTEMCDRHLNK